MATSIIKKPETMPTYLKPSNFVTERTFSATYSINGNATISLPEWSIAKSGYKVLGAVGFYSGGQIFTVSQVRVNYDTNTISLVVHNTSSTSYSNRQAHVDILYVKNI